MAGPHRRPRPVLGLVVALTVMVGWVVAPAATEAAPPAWDGSINLYRKGVFTTQKSWLWCTAAGVQIIRNMVENKRDHTAKNQRRYFRWMRRHNRYDLPVSAGVDPQGWAAGLRHYVDSRYKLVASGSFDRALRLAVLRMRKTNLPVALTVARGNHGWVLHGFAATADPLKTDDYRITSVRVTGPLYGLQSRSYGYDMKPNKKLTPAQLKRFFTPWRYAPKRMIWDGRYVSIQPVTPRASTSSSGEAAVAAAASESASIAAPPPEPSVSPTIASTPTPTPSTAAAAVAPLASPPPREPAGVTRAPPDQASMTVPIAALLVAAGLVVMVLATFRRQRGVGPAR
jgi:hypothetical protein